ncbi:MAG: radical SAM protein [Clostridia bacterium]|nr:radical SAM protein [Clostridia bacterium]
MKHVNIPIFIPHMGCPNQCVFCNQRSISGHMDFSLDDVRGEIETALSTVSADTETEIAFFGGSFTGIERDLMINLLDIAQEYIEAGRVSSIRLSTRPDYINEEILDILSRYAVKTVELGLQSMDRAVLDASKRGHGVECAEHACKMIKKKGFSLVGQMMIGLPGSTVETEIMTARKICDMGADGARIYPTVVFRDTELSDMMKSGKYIPLELSDAVYRTKEALSVFAEAGVPCIRVGLCAGENLSSPDQALGGANHSAIGELAMSALYLDKIEKKIDALDEDISGKNIVIYVPRGDTSKVVGQKRSNIEKITQKYSPRRIKVLEKDEILRYNIIIGFLDI